MTAIEKLTMVKTLLEISLEDRSKDELISAYIMLADREILSWRYSYSAQPADVVPCEYDTVAVMAVVAGYSQGGAENQLQHSENGISRVFKYADMVAYIRAHVIPLCKVT